MNHIQCKNELCIECRSSGCNKFINEVNSCSIYRKLYYDNLTVKEIMEKIYEEDLYE